MAWETLCETIAQDTAKGRAFSSTTLSLPLQGLTHVYMDLAAEPLDGMKTQGTTRKKEIVTVRHGRFSGGVQTRMSCMPSICGWDGFGPASGRQLPASRTLAVTAQPSPQMRPLLPPSGRSGRKACHMGVATCFGGSAKWLPSFVAEFYLLACLQNRELEDRFPLHFPPVSMSGADRCTE